MNALEQRYYDALFIGNKELAKRLYRVPEVQAGWSADRLVREAHKCGIYDEADRLMATGPLEPPHQPLREAIGPWSTTADVLILQAELQNEKHQLQEALWKVDKRLNRVNYHLVQRNRSGTKPR